MPCTDCTPGTYSTLNNFTLRRSCEICDAGKLQPLGRQTRCVECPTVGVDCTSQAEIMVEPSYYRPDDADLKTSLLRYSRAGELVLAVACPWGTAACLGGNVTGDELCAAGHSDRFCGRCNEPDYYRGSSSCVACPEDPTRAAVVSTVLCLAVLLAMVLYLRTATAQPTGAAVAGPKPGPAASCWLHVTRFITRLPHAVHRKASAIAKIVLGLVQCLATLRSFSLVRWPETFATFIGTVDRLNADAFSMVPFECHFKKRFGFYWEMGAALLLPVISFGLIMCLASLVYGYEYHQLHRRRAVTLQEVAAGDDDDGCNEGGGGGSGSGSGDRGSGSGRGSGGIVGKGGSGGKLQRSETSFWLMLRRPQVWTLNIWCWLILYPSVTRKALSAFDCIELQGKFWLRADPVIACDGEERQIMAILAALGAFASCVGGPCAIVALTSRYRNSPSKLLRARVALLTNTYRDGYHYFEAVDLTRKLLLTSVVLLAWPATLQQLWFAAATGLAFIVLYVGLDPYRDKRVGRIQTVALVQLELTYVTAALFFNRQPHELVGVMLVLANSFIAFALLLFTMVYVREVAAEVTDMHLTFDADGGAVKLRPPEEEGGNHLFLSHTWKHAQCGTIKSLLYTMLPTCKAYLDVDDQSDDLDAEEQVCIYIIYRADIAHICV